MKKHSVMIAGHRTSVSLEQPFWHALNVLARREKVSLSELIRRIDAARLDDKPGTNLSSALRLYVLEACWPTFESQLLPPFTPLPDESPTP